METFTVKNLTFTYPQAARPALADVSFTVSPGEMIVICGQSGSGKSTLLRNLKPILAPHGNRQGEILFDGVLIDQLDQEQQTAKIGYVLQNPDNQIVTDKVWHELAFGLESLGMDTKTIRLRVAEMASFFGIQTWFHKEVNHLSGGQKQILNLASVMAMQPEILILDEPTSQLDPIAASDFLETIEKINRELGTTVIITEHRLEEVLTMAERAMVLDQGRIVADDTPANVGAILAQNNHSMFMAMPTPLQAYSILYQDDIGKSLPCPVNVRDGRNWLSKLFAGKKPSPCSLPAEPEIQRKDEPVIEMKEVWFRYGKQEPDVVKDLSMRLYPGEFFCLVGGNGTGKTTTLALAGGLRRPYRGSVKIKGKKVSTYKNNELFQGILGILPQNPQSIFVKKTVREDLLEMFEGSKLSKSQQLQRVQEVLDLVEISHLTNMHPYDLSGGEQQRAAMAKILLLDPEILLLDEPTKGLDSGFKFKLAAILKRLQQRGIAILMVSHDIEFCGRYADRCAMFFDGKIITTNTPRRFFSGNSFYTTAANRISRHLFENAVNVDDIVTLVRQNFGKASGDLLEGGETSLGCGTSAGVGSASAPLGIEKERSLGGDPCRGSSEKDGEEISRLESELVSGDVRMDEAPDQTEASSQRQKEPQSRSSEDLAERLRQQYCGAGGKAGNRSKTVRAGRQEKPGTGAIVGDPAQAAFNHEEENLEKPGALRRMGLDLGMLFLGFVTIIGGYQVLGDRKYFVISVLLVLYALIPFFAGFERKKPKAREIVILAVLIATAVVGRAAFFMIPNFKPIVAIIIISGVALGKESGFLVGAMSAFVSNFLFGQGPWTPYQMIAMAIIGYLAGLIFHRFEGRIRIFPLVVFGALTTFFLYGAIVDLWTIFSATSEPTMATVIGIYAAGVPFNLTHAAATAIFLLLLTKPMLGKLNRVRVKYGMEVYG